MPGGHDGDDQLAAGKRVCDPLRLRCGAAGNRKTPRFCSRRDERVIGAASAAPVTVLIRPFRHLHRIDQIVCERGYYHCHSSRAAAVAADIISTIGLVRIAFIELIVIDDLCAAICVADVSKRRDREAALRRGKILKQAVAQKQAEILGKVLRKRLLLGGQMKMESANTLRRDRSVCKHAPSLHEAP